MLQGFRWSKRPNELLFRMIAEQTLQAGKTGNLLANKPEIDFILRLAATTQISEAIAKMGTRKGEPFLVVVAGETKAARALAGGAGWKTLKKYDLSKEELDMVENAALQNARRG
jgi:tRNA threonylcarbamoyladenosine modification (KEOPS) complex Cgi121 subunit